MASSTRYAPLSSQPDEASSSSGPSRSATTSGPTSARASPLYEGHPLLRSLLARAGVYGATAFAVICMLLSLLPSRPGSQAHALGLAPERRRDRTMDSATCRAEFPLLFPQLDDNVAAWRAKGGIAYGELDEAARTCASNWGMARVVIRDGQLFLRQVREGGESRISALLHLLHTAVISDPSSSSGANSTGIELVLSEADKDASPSDAVWVLSKRLDESKDKGTWLLPDFGFAGWPETGIASFDEFLHLAQLQDRLQPWSYKGNKILWRGLANGYPPRVDLLAKTDPRQVPGAEAWADVKQTSFHDVGAEFHPLIPMHEHCRHRFLVQTEGNSYSGRGKFLWSCRSVVVAHKLDWTQHFHPALNADPLSSAQNFVELPGPLFQGLEQTTLQLQRTADIPAAQDLTPAVGEQGALGKNPPQRIAQNAVASLRERYLTPAATACYLRAALSAYAGVLKTDTWPREDNAPAWDNGGEGIVPHGGPGGGVAPGGGKGKDLNKVGVKGDIEYGVWRLSGSPDWPPKP